MKANIYNYNGVLQAQLENGSSIESSENEAVSAFRKRVENYIIEIELEDPELSKNVTFAAVKKYSLTKIKAEISGGATGLYLEMLKAVETIHAEAVGGSTPDNAAEVENQAAALRAEKAAERAAVKEAKEKAKEEKAAAREALKAAKLAEKEKKAAEREKAKKEKAAAREAAKAEKEAARQERLANKPSVEQVLQEAKGLKSMKNQVVSFIPFGSSDEESRITGIVNGVVTDKRVPMNLLRIYVGIGSEKATYHLRPTNPTLQVDREASAALAQEKADAEQAKADAIQAKADAKEAAKLEKARIKAEALKAKEVAKEAKAEAKRQKEEAKRQKEEAAKADSPVVAPKGVYEFDADEEE